MRVMSFLAAENMHHCEAAAVEAAASVVPASSWGDIVASLTSPAPPGALVVDAGGVSREGAATLSALSDRGLLVPTTLFLASADAASMSAAWNTPREIVSPTFTRAELALFLRTCAQSGIRWSLAAYLVSHLTQTRPIPDLLHLLASVDEAARWSVSRIAAELRVSRTTLYSRLRDAGAPPLEQIQVLFQLLPAVQMLQLGIGSEDVAYRVGFADAASLRKALRNRLGVPVSELRSQPGWRSTVCRWLDHQRGADRLQDPSGGEI